MAKPREFKSEFKARVVLQVLTGTKTTAQVCREHKLHEQLISRWKQQFLERASLIFDRPGQEPYQPSASPNSSASSAASPWSWRSQKKPLSS